MISRTHFRVPRLKKAVATAAAFGLAVSLSVTAVSVSSAPAVAAEDVGGATVSFSPQDKLLTTREVFTGSISVDVEPSPTLDLVWLVDMTASMKQKIMWVERAAQFAVDRLPALGITPYGVNVQYAVAGFDDLTSGNSTQNAFQWVFWFRSAGYNQVSDVEDALTDALQKIGDGGDIPDDSIYATMQTIIDLQTWRTWAPDHIMVFTDAAAKERPGANLIPGYSVDASGLKQLALDKDVTLSFHTLGDRGVITSPVDDPTTERGISIPDLKDALGNIATLDHSDTEDELKANLSNLVIPNLARAKIVPSVSCVYASDGKPSTDVSVDLNPASLDVTGVGPHDISVTATTAEPPQRLGDRRIGSPDMEETICTVQATVNGKKTSVGQTIRWDPYQALPPEELSPPQHSSVRQSSAATVDLKATSVDGGTVSYQWYENTVDSTIGGTLIPGATGDSYSPPDTTVLGKTYYYAKMTNTLPGAYYDTAEAFSSVGSIDVVLAPSYAQTLVVTPSSGTAVVSGGELDYTATIMVGGAYTRASVKAVNDLSGLLDDAVLVSGPTSSSSDLVVGPVGADGRFSITGFVYSGVDTTVTYRVRVNQTPSDDLLVNVLECDPKNGRCKPQMTSNPVASLELVHTAAPQSSTGLFVAGEVVDLVYHVTNTGLVELTGVTIAEDKFTGSDPLGGITCPAGSLAPGASVDCTATYTLTQTDADAGLLSSTAHATGLTPVGSAGEAAQLVESGQDEAHLPDVINAALSLSESVNGLDPQAPLVGQVLTYSYGVTNTGNISVRGISIVQTAFSGGSPVALTCPDTTTTAFAPTQSITCTGTYTITQADVDAGAITNTAHAIGMPVSGPMTVDSPDASGRVTLSQVLGLTLAKSASITAANQFVVGDLIIYSFDATNTGNVTIHDLEIIERSFDGSGNLSAVTCPVRSLAPAASTTCTAAYQITQTDVDTSSITNWASARARGPVTAADPAGIEVDSLEAWVTVVGASTPELKLDQTVSAFDPSQPWLGQQLTYSYTITNTGNVSIRTISIVGTAFSGAPTPAVTCRGSRLAPGVSTICTATYTVTQADIDSGAITSMTHATGTGPGRIAVNSPEVPATVDFPGAAAVLSVNKVDTPHLSTPSKPGDTIDYTITVTNTGTQTATNVAVDDALVGSTYTSETWPPGRAAGTLEPGEWAEFTATYTIDQADVDAKSVDNKAVATGQGPGGQDLTASAEAATWLGDGVLHLGIVKTADASGLTHPLTALGDTITYTLTVTNQGSLTVTDVDVTDALAKPADLNWDWTGAKTQGTLEPGESVQASFDHPVTQVHIDAGHVVNAAFATGKGPGNLPISSASNQVDTPLSGEPVLEVAKTANTSRLSNPIRVGDPVDYTITVTNTGNRTAHNVQVADPLLGVAPSADWSHATSAGLLAPHEYVTVTGSYAVKQSDLDAGEVDNTASADGQDPDGAAIYTGTSQAKTPLPGRPVLTVTQVANGSKLSNPPAAGDRIDYTIHLTNTGNRTAHDVQLQDPLLGATASADWSHATSTGWLAPGEYVTLTGSYVVTQADLDAGEVVNTATATAKDPDDVTVAPGTAVENTPLAGGPVLNVVKLADTSGLSSPARLGDQVDYLITVSNLGNQTAHAVQVSDSLLGGAASTDWSHATSTGVLVPGEYMTLTGSYTVTQADLDAGEIANTATATGKDPSNGPVGPGTDSVTTTLDGAAVLSVVKIANSSKLADPVAVGDQIDYTIQVTNTGNRTAHDVQIADPLLGAAASADWSQATSPGLLAPGQYVTVTGSYAVKQADLDAGRVINTATATGKDPDDVPVVPASDGQTTDLAGGPALDVVATPDGSRLSSPARVGDQIDYTIRVTNTGNRTAHDVRVSDQLLGGSASPDWSNATSAGVLAPGQYVTVTGTYTVTQPDLETGQVVNTATANGKDPDGLALTPSSDVQAVALDGAPILSVQKTADGSALSDPVAVGDQIDYTIQVTNTGNRTAHDVQVADPLLGGAASEDWSQATAVGVLAPGQHVTVTGSYTVTQSDLNAGQVVNTATATGKDPDDVPTTLGVDGQTTDMASSPALSLVKLADPSGLSSPAQVGQQIGYTIRVSNLGNQTAHDVQVSDPKLGGAPSADWSQATSAGVLAPGEYVTVTGAYTVTQADLDAGEVVNTATATGKDPTSAPVSPVTDSQTTTLDGAPILSVVKLADGSRLNDPAAVGDQIDYTITVTNTGNQTAHDVQVSDPLLGGSASADWSHAAGAGLLRPGQYVTVTGSYSVTQSDLDAGLVANTATATAKDPDNLPTTPGRDSQITDLSGGPVLEVIKTADTSGLSNPAAIGDRISYTIKVSNTGNQSAQDVQVSDPLLGGSASTDWSHATAAGVLAPGQYVTLTGTYTVTQVDLDAGQVLNIATATGKDPAGAPVIPGLDDETTMLSGAAVLALTKAADGSGLSNPVSVGNLINYTITVTNTGNRTAHDVKVSDPKLGATAPEDWSHATADGVLAPGEYVTVTGAYAVTQGDLDAGHLANHASVFGLDPDGVDVDGEDETDTSLAADPVLSVAIKADHSRLSKPPRAGDQIDYAITVSNAGNRTAHDVQVSDFLLGGAVAPDWSYATSPGVLAPGEQVALAGSYRLKQADLDKGSLTNTATATGKDPDDVAVPAGTADEITKLDGAPVLSVAKVADGSKLNDPAVIGDQIDYTITVTNTGNRTAFDVQVDDPMLGATAATDWSQAASSGVVAPGEYVTVTGHYKVTQADLNSGQVINTATATANDPGKAPVTPGTDSQTVDLAGGPVLSVVATASDRLTNPARVGQTIDYTVMATNTGNQAASSVVIKDALVNDTFSYVSWPGTPGLVGPGESVLATVTYRITQADIDAGHVLNQVTVAGKSPRGDDIEGDDQVDILLSGAPVLTVAKTADGSKLNDPAVVGDRIDYTIQVTNTGNQTAHDVQVSDPKLGATASADWSHATADGVLAPGQYVVVTGSYAVTQADLNAGRVINTATASGKNLGNVSTTPGGDGEVTDLAGGPVLNVTNKADASRLSKPPRAGDQIDYAITVSNTGNRTAHDVRVSDFLLGGAVAPDWSYATSPGVLAPGEQVALAGSYRLKQADLDKGQVINTATATGKDPDDVAVPAGTADEITKLDGAPILTVTKIANGSKLNDPAVIGDQIDYTITVTNTGNRTASDVQVDDPKLGGTAATDWSQATSSGVLAPGEYVTVTGHYKVTLADLNSGQVANTATATAKDPDGVPITPASDSQTVNLAGGPVLSVVATASDRLSNPASVGEKIDYTVMVTNIGNQAASGVVIKDALVNDTFSYVSWPGTPGLVGAGESVVATVTYAITQGDIDAGHVLNQVTVAGKDPRGNDIEGEDEVDILVSGAPLLVVNKGADTSKLHSPTQVGDVIYYTVMASNLGNRKIENLSLTDNLPGLSVIDYIWGGTAGTLGAGESVVMHASYTLTLADLERGHVANRAFATGTDPDGGVHGGQTQTPSTDTPLDAETALDLVKTADLSAVQEPAQAGDVVTYTFTVTNVGARTAHDVEIVDNMPGLSSLVYQWPAGGTPRELQPGQSATATATYWLTAADIAAGQVLNKATVTGTDPDGNSVDPPEVSVITDPNGDPALSMVKRADLSQVHAPAQAGDVITYTIEVTNTGDRTVTDVKVTDNLTGLSALQYAWPQPARPGVLGVGQKLIATATYTITQADLAAGQISNKATATGQGPGGDLADPGQGEITVPMGGQPALVLTKTSDAAGLSASVQAGQVITYSFQVTNQGNQTATGVAILDLLPGLSPLAYNWPGPEGVLDPGQTVTASAVYPLTAADIAAGHVANHASVSGQGLEGQDAQPGGDGVDTLIPNLNQTGLAITMAADASSVTKAGQVITYRFLVSNTGRADIGSISVQEGAFTGTGPLPGVTCPAQSLTSGQNMTCTATYKVKPADLRARQLSNTATVIGTPTGGDSITSDPASLTLSVDVPRVPGINLPFTGSLALHLLPIGLGLCLIGLGLMFIPTRRGRRHQSA